MQVARSDANLPPLTEFVPRAVEHPIRERAARAAAGQNAIIVLTSDSTAGKKRILWEVIQDPSFSDWWLWPTLSPEEPEILLSDAPQFGPRTVVWLPYLGWYLRDCGPGLGNQVARMLRDLLEDKNRGPFLILGTLSTARWRKLVTRQADDRPERCSHIRHLLLGNDIPVPDRFTKTEYARALASPDPRLGDAATHAPSREVIQYLVGVPDLLARYDNASPEAKAVLNAAMDMRRLWHPPWMDPGFLENAAFGYLTEREGYKLPPDWFRAALDEMTALGSGDHSPLRRRHDGLLGLHEILDRRAGLLRKLEPPSAQLCDQLIETIAAEDCLLLGHGMLRCGLLRHAIACYLRVPTPDRPTALRHAGEALLAAGRSDEALRCLGEAVLRDEEAVTTVVRLFVGQGQPEAAVEWLGAFAGQDRRRTLVIRANLLVEIGRWNEAGDLFRRAADLGEDDAIDAAADAAAVTYRHENLREWLGGLARQGRKRALVVGARTFRESEPLARVLEWLAELGDSGVDEAWLIGAEELFADKRAEDGFDWCAKAEDRGVVDVFAVRARAYLAIGLLGEAQVDADRAAEAGDPSPLCEVADLLAEVGLRKRATLRYLRAAELKHPTALGKATLLAATSGDLDRMRVFHRQGSSPMLKEVADALAAAGFVEAAADWCLEIADLTEPHVLVPAVEYVLAADRVDAAIDRYESTVGTSRAEAAYWIADTLIAANSPIPALRSLTTAGELGHPLGFLKAAEILIEANRHTEAISFLNQASNTETEAQRGKVANLRAVALAYLGRFEEASTLIDSRLDSGDPGAACRVATALMRTRSATEHQALRPGQWLPQREPFDQIPDTLVDPSVQRRRRATAMGILERAAEIGDVPALLLLGDELARDGEVERACDCYLRAALCGEGSGRDKAHDLLLGHTPERAAQLQQHGVGADGKIATPWTVDQLPGSDPLFKATDARSQRASS